MFWKKWKKKERIETVDLTENGFLINYNGEISQFEWNEIDKLTGFKFDRLTIDEICLNIEAENKIAIATEDFIGWRKFMTELLNKFPEIDKNWEGIIAQSPFKRNETVLFSRIKTEGVFNCTECGKVHSEWPALAFSSPANYHNLSDDEKSKIGKLDTDFCEIHYKDQIDRFIRVTLTQKVKDACETLEYGLWVSLSEKSYLDYKENYNNPNHKTGYFGWLCSNIPQYGETISIPCDVMTRTGNSRPEIFPHQDFDHPFVRDYYYGITKKDAEKRINEMIKNLG
ncbi:DUF2199 domain-containing protein [Aquimarina brevivitae]|uniref:DUF2199 domain-containing protein n=1 Tax=Aquimarina brevivitae TaxID=323412 RepID=A0A4Q7NZJ6_9FLAO|nr:DUF2199 domain-containing protein [Aquimarina brevivitae]RZS91862.1 hypothetical protein EV197_2965 [Aquimarina brevivitae]